MAAVHEIDSLQSRARPRVEDVDPSLLLLEDEGDSRSAAEYWDGIKRFKWSVLGIVLMAAALGAFNAYTASPVYRADARLLVQISPATASGLNAFDPLPLRWLFFETQQDIIASRAVALDVVQRLGLDAPPVPATTPRKPDPAWKAELKAWRDRLPKWQQLIPEEWREPPPPPPTAAQRTEQAIGKVRGGLIVEGGRDSEVIKIGYTDSNAENAARIANAVADAYIEFGLRSRMTTVKETGDWLGGRLEELRIGLQQSEAALREYQAAEGLIDSEQRDSILTVRFDTLTREQVEANATRSEAQARYEQLRAARSGSRSNDEALIALLATSIVTEAGRTKADALKKVTELGERYGEKHPRMIAARAELNRASSALTSHINKAIDAVRKEYEIARAREAKLTRLLSQLESEQRSASAKTAKLAQLEREVESNRKLYDTYLERSRQADISDENGLSNVRIVDRASVPLAPFKPDRTRILTLYLLAGIVLGIVLAIARDQMDNTFRSRDALEKKLGLPVLGVVPRMRGRRSRGVERMTLEQPVSQFSEAVNDVRTAVMLSDVDTPPQVVLLTSATADEGKTTLASNLACAFGRRGRTLLIETDLRCGRLASVMGIDESPGLTDFCSGDMSLQEVIQPVPESPDLYLLPSGRMPPNPLEILSSQRFAEALASFRQHFEHIVIDAAPVLPVSDSIIVGRHADAILLVVRAHKTTHDMAKDGLKRLLAARLRPVGAVLQQAEFHKTRRYAYDYGAYYQYQRG